jgi:hypothetical protein
MKLCTETGLRFDDFWCQARHYGIFIVWGQPDIYNDHSGSVGSHGAEAKADAAPTVVNVEVCLLYRKVDKH